MQCEWIIRYTLSNNDNFDELFPVFCVSSAAWELFQCTSKQGMSIIPDHWLPRRWHPVIWTLSKMLPLLMLSKRLYCIGEEDRGQREVQTFGFLLSLYHYYNLDSCNRYVVGSTICRFLDHNGAGRGSIARELLQNWEQIIRRLAMV